MAPDSSILAWKVPWAEEPGGLTVHGATESDMTEHMHTHTRTHSGDIITIMTANMPDTIVSALAVSPHSFLTIYL